MKRTQRITSVSARRSAIWLLVTLLLFAAAAAYVWQHRDGLSQLPTVKNLPFDSLSKSIEDDRHNLYLIDNAKKTIYKLSPDGTLLMTIQSEAGKNGELYRFNDLSVDPQNRLYAVRTLLDPYGITVKSEQIVQYDASGRLEHVIFNQDYNDPGFRRYRVGGIKTPQWRGGSLYFFNDDGPKVTLYRLSEGENAPKALYALTYPDNKYLSEIVGYVPGSIYYSTRSGEIYRATADNQSVLLYPLPGIDRSRRNFPESLQMDSKGRLMFVDYTARAISRLDPKQPYIIEELVNEAKAKAAGVDIGFENTTLSVAQDDGTIIVDDQTLNRRKPDGTFGAPIDSAAYSQDYRMQQWLLWAAAVAGALLLLWGLKLLYFDVLQRRVSLVIKQIVVFVPLITASMILLSLVIYNNFANKLETEMERELVLLAGNGQNLIDGDLLAKMESPLEYRGDTYKLFRKRINTVFFNPDGENIELSKENEGFYKAVYKYENGSIYRILEDDDSVHMFNPFPATDNNQKVVKEGKIVNGEWSDSTGEWKYAIAPIRDSNGTIVGIFETDQNMEGIIAHRRAVMRTIIYDISIITGAIVLLFILMTFLQLSSLRKLRSSVMEISKGNWSTVVRLRTRDEVSDLGDSFNQMTARIREYIGKVEQFSQAYYRFVPQQFLKLLDKETILDVKLGDQTEQTMNTLSCGLRGFSRLAKRLTPEESFNFVNSFLKRFGPYVRNHNGMVNKYAGAGFVALFPDEHTDDALTACIEMRRELELYNTHRDNVHYAPVDLAIGLHRGPLRLGIVGEEQRLDSNVISDDVNIASLLERLTETLGASILITDRIVRSLADAGCFQYRDLGLVRAEGMGAPLHLYDVYEGDPETIRTLKERTKAKFEEAVTLYQVGRFYDARETFLMIIKQNRQDKAAQLYFYLCDEYFQKGTAADWNGSLSVS